MKKTIVVFSGAGISHESGIPTFRDMGGLWQNFKIEDVASPIAWKNNRQTVLDFYAMRINNYKSCKSNAAHFAIAKLQSYFTVYAITQNVDSLHEEAEVKDVWHLHGSIMNSKCENHFDCTFGDDVSKKCNFKSKITKPLTAKDKCPQCGGNLRPDIVWFGEPVDMREEFVNELTRKTDIFIGVGTSARVYPAAGLLSKFRNVDNKYFIDPNPLYSCLEGFEVIEGKAAVELPKLVDNLIREKSGQRN